MFYNTVHLYYIYVHTHIVCHRLVRTGSNCQLNEESRGLVLLQLMPPERLLLCGGRPLNTEPQAGALEITVLRVSEIAPAILIMSPTLIPYVHWLQAQREKERERRLTQSPAPISPSAAPTASCWSLKIAPISQTHSSVSCLIVSLLAGDVLNIVP